MKLRIEPAGTTHLGLLAEMHAACFAEKWDALAFARLMASPGAFALLATTDAGPTGFALARLAGGEAEILAIGVIPAGRRRGVGAALLGAVQDRADTAPLFLEVAAGNAGAIALYRAAGFRQVGIRPAYYADLQDALVMRRDSTNQAGPGDSITK